MNNRRYFSLFWLCFCLFPPHSGAQEGERLPDWDMDALFSEIPGEAPEDVPQGDGETGGILRTSLKRPGFILETAFNFYGGISPGWTEAPWYWEDQEEEHQRIIGLGMSAQMGLDFQISGQFRVKATFGVSLPEFKANIEDFFFDYQMKEFLFLRAGKYTHNWGISPNFPFTNLLARVPHGNAGGDSLLAKADIPLGVGGLQGIVLTRRYFMADPTAPTAREIGYGGKYNLAFPWADIDLGVFYHYDMPLRGFVSVKSTLADTEIYTEGMTSISHDTWTGLKFSANIGLVRDFFSGKLRINGEFFYNGELNEGWFHSETDYKEAEISPFIKGPNAGLNLSFRPGFAGLRFFTHFLHGFDEDTSQLVPGFSFSPFSNMEFSFALPMALGSREGTYYRKNADTKNRPFALVFLLTFKGSYRFNHRD